MISEFAHSGVSFLIAGFAVTVVALLVAAYSWGSPADTGADKEPHGAQFIVPLMMEAWDLVKKNQFCQALGFSSVSYYVVYVLGFVYRTVILPIFSSLSSSIVVHNTDPNFTTIVDYLSEHILSESKAAFSTVQATTKKRDMTRKDWIHEWLGTNASRDVPKFEYRPDTDNIIHSFIYKGHKVYLSRSKSGDALMGSNSERPFTPESLTLTVWGNDGSVLRDLLAEALVAVLERKREDMLSIYIQSSASWCVGWELALTKKARPKNSVILDVDDMDILLNDARKFMNSSAWYLEKGIPYRRGYMLYGPPGCGKTSFAQVLAGELKLDICMLALTHAGLTDNDLCELLRDAPRNSVIVLEDVDAVFVERNATGESNGGGKKGGSCVSFSGLLNAIDGVASQEGKIFFMTTNHIEKLDAALLRPGRCDVKFEVKNASKQQMERMFLRFYPGETALATEFATRLPANELSMAALQGHFLNDAQSAEESVERTMELLQSIKGTTKKTCGSVAECLFRVGLDHYAYLFYFQGCMSASSMSTIEVKDVLPLSLNLRYDAAGCKLLEKVMQGNENLMREQFTMATLSDIRSSFLAAYPTTHERLTGELSPFLRRQTSHSKARQLKALMTATMVDVEHNLDEFPHLAGLARGVSVASSETLMCVDMSAEEIDVMSQRFCTALSRNGKGAISLHNLKVLLEIHPNRPGAAVEAAKHFVFENGTDSKYLGAVIKPTTLYEFLKRLGLRSKYHNFYPRLDTIDAVRDLGDLKKVLCEQYKLSRSEALCVSEVMDEKESETGNLINFAYHSRNRIMHVFIAFYATQSHAVEGLSPSASNEQALPSLAPLNLAMLETMAYDYAFAATTPRGLATVSVLEVLAHLRSHEGSPEDALRTALSELVDPPFPERPSEAVSPPPAPKEWIETWLESDSHGPELVKYAKAFIGQDIKTEEDLRIGGAIDDGDLSNIMKIESLGHRRRIFHMIEVLLGIGGQECKK